MNFWFILQLYGVVKRAQLLNATIKGVGVVADWMSVQHGRTQRQLSTADKALSQFIQIEGRAMSPTRMVSLDRAAWGLVLIVAASTLTTIGVYNSNTHIIYMGLLVLLIVAYWMFVYIS